jgi:alkylation response protein AidB-like acyl-CoA dehydrogenase
MTTNTEPHVTKSAAGVAAEARSWLRETWDPDLTVRQWWTKLAESGWGCPTWPIEWFGRGLSTDEGRAVHEVFLELDVLAPPSGSGIQLAGPTLLTHANDEVKNRHLGPIVRGEVEWVQYFSEPGAGSDLAGLQTTARRVDGGWIVNGQKIWSSRGHVADQGMLLARTDSAVPKHEGITYFVVDVDQPQIETRPIYQMNGDASFNEVFFTGAFVDDRNVVGEVNGGWRVAMTTLAFERFVATALPAVSPGIKGGNLDMRAGDALLKGREGLHRLGNAFGDTAPKLMKLARELGRDTDPIVRQEIGYLFELEQTARALSMRQAPGLRGSRDAVGSIRKLARSRIARATRDLGMSLLGAYGLLVGPGTESDGVIQHLALSAPRASLGGGTDQIQLNIVSERLLGMPREPREDDRPFNQLKVGTQPAR